MTQVVTVHTEFTDLNQMAQGLVGRVNETHVILPDPNGVPVGDWVQFAITLYDGTPGFAGVGRCVTVVDNGEERLSHQRYDVVIDSLQFDSRGQQIFEHILMLNGSAEEVAEDVSEAYSEPEIHQTGSYVDAGDVSEDFNPSEPPPAHEEAEEEATVIGGRAQMAAAFAQAAQANAEEAYEDADDDIAVASMPPPAVAEAAPVADAYEADAYEADAYEADAYDAPVAAPEVAAAPQVANGHAYAPSPSRPVDGNSFRFEGGLPFPAVPPRPDLPPSRAVSKAPRPA